MKKPVRERWPLTAKKCQRSNLNANIRIIVRYSKWLPTDDSNVYYNSQNVMCYHYTSWQWPNPFPESWHVLRHLSRQPWGVHEPPSPIGSRVVVRCVVTTAPRPPIKFHGFTHNQLFNVIRWTTGNFLCLVVRAGLEPAQPFRPSDLNSDASTNSATRPFCTRPRTWTETMPC